MSHVILIDCPDQRGLIAKFSTLFTHHNVNIIGNWEFVDKAQQHFFMRTEVDDLKSVDLLLKDIQNILPSEGHIKIHAKTKKKIVILATKESHCLGDLLLRSIHGDLPAEIQAVISNHNVLEKLVQRFEIPFHFCSHLQGSRMHQEEDVIGIIESLNPDYIVLAKYMRILSPEFVQRFPEKIINIHHSFLPAFVGARPYHQAYDRGVKIIGATSHFVNDDLDEGPIIAQNVIPVDHTKSAEEMAAAGQDVEKITLARALRLVLEDRVFVKGNRTIIFE